MQKQELEPHHHTEAPLHYLDAQIINKDVITVVVAGAGGTGSHLLNGLASLDLMLASTCAKQLEVWVFDPDVVSASNVGRQAFAATDVGLPKAFALVGRLNRSYGLSYRSVSKPLSAKALESYQIRPDILISCVDSVAARCQFAHEMFGLEAPSHIEHAVEHSQASSRVPSLRYWMDSGNDTDTGQWCLGYFPDRRSDTNCASLPCVVERFEQMWDKEFAQAQDPKPSCSVKEALSKQSLFINRAMATHMLDTLWRLLSQGSVSHCAQFINLKAGICSSVAIAPFNRAAAQSKNSVKDTAAHPALHNRGDLVAG